MLLNASEILFRGIFFQVDDEFRVKQNVGIMKFFYGNTLLE